MVNSISEIKSVDSPALRVIWAFRTFEFLMKTIDSVDRSRIKDRLQRHKEKLVPKFKDICWAVGVRHTVTHATGRSHTDAELNRAANHLIWGITRLVELAPPSVSEKIVGKSEEFSELENNLPPGRKTGEETKTSELVESKTTVEFLKDIYNEDGLAAAIFLGILMVPVYAVLYGVLALVGAVCGTAIATISICDFAWYRIGLIGNLISAVLVFLVVYSAVGYGTYSLASEYEWAYLSKLRLERNGDLDWVMVQYQKEIGKAQIAYPTYEQCRWHGMPENWMLVGGFGGLLWFAVCRLQRVSVGMQLKNIVVTFCFTLGLCAMAIPLIIQSYPEHFYVAMYSVVPMYCFGILFLALAPIVNFASRKIDW